MPKIVDANTRANVLRLSEPGNLKNREIARLCFISPRMVSKIRAEERARKRELAKSATWSAGIPQ